MISAFGVDHGDVISKKTLNDGPDTKASYGRHLTAQVAPGIHGAIAGKQGKKVRAFGNEVGGGALGGISGMAIGGGLGALTRNPVAATAGAGIGNVVGSRVGIAGGVKRNQRKGYYAPKPKQG